VARKLRPSGEAPASAPPLGRVSALVALGAGAYMTALSQSVVSAILPIVTAALDADVATIEWVLALPLLIQAGLLLGFGRLGDLRGHRPLYLAGLVLFVGSSALSGLAPSAGFLIAARALQAVGGSMLFATSSAILIHAVPPQQRGRAIGFQATMVYLGIATGPPLGGWLAEALNWRWVFYVNIPLGLAVLALSLRYIPRDAPPRRGERFDWLGAVIYALGLSALMLALNQGHAWGWTSAMLLGCAGVGLALLGLFVAIELRIPSPMLDLGLFRRRAFTAPVLSAVLNYMCVSSTFFLLPFFLIQGRGLSAAQAGFILAAQPIIMALTATFSGAFSDRVGSRLPATAGMGVLAVGLLLLSRAGDATPLAYVAGALALMGLGIGLFTSPNSSAVMGAVPSSRRGVASGILATARTLGNVLGLGMASAIFNTILHGAGPDDSAAIVEAVGAGLTAAAAIALLGAITSATRPGRDASS
jgi:EmrB/QacA subfamily drug resistance transporter